MKRRLFLVGMVSLLFSCAANTITYYADGLNDLNKMKKQLSDKKEKIVDIQQDPQNKRFYIIKVKN